MIFSQKGRTGTESGHLNNTIFIIIIKYVCCVGKLEGLLLPPMNYYNMLWHRRNMVQRMPATTGEKGFILMNFAVLN